MDIEGVDVGVGEGEGEGEGERGCELVGVHSH